MKELVDEYRFKLVEAIAELDEDLLEKYLEGEELTEAELKSGIRQATIANTIIPVTCGSSYKNKGVQKLLDCVVDYMPSPLDVPHIKGVVPEPKSRKKENPQTMLRFRLWHLRL